MHVVVKFGITMVPLSGAELLLSLKLGTTVSSLGGKKKKKILQILKKKKKTI